MTTRTHTGLFTHCCVSSVIFAVSVFALFVATAVQAAEWRIEPLFGAAGEFDDNGVLSPRTDVDADISGYLLEASARFAYASETTDFFITPRLLRRDYGDPNFDSDDQFLRFDFDHDTVSSNFRLRGDYGRESARTGERADVDLEVEDPDEIPDDESGRVSIRDRREKFRIMPSWTYRMSSLSSFSVNLDYTDVRYDEAFAGLLTDYTNARVNVAYSRSFSPRNTGILSGTYRQYEADGSAKVTGSGFNAGFERTLSETTRLRALVGLEDTDREAGGSDVNWVANISLARRLQTIIMLAQYRRTISGGGSGTLSSRDSINLNFTRRLTERISAGLGVRAYQTNALDDAVVTFDERDYVQLRSQFTWYMTQSWSLQANYRYTFQNRSLLGESANSNAVTVWLNYRPTPIIRSR